MGRSVPDLELVKESSLMSIIRWNCKANMDKTMSSDDAHITLVMLFKICWGNLYLDFLLLN